MREPYETTKLPATDAPHLAAVAYLAVLAYPHETAKRDEFLEAGRALVLKQAVNDGYPRQDISTRWRRIPNRKIDNRLTAGFRRIVRRRLPVAHVAPAGLIAGAHSFKSPVTKLLENLAEHHARAFPRNRRSTDLDSLKWHEDGSEGKRAEVISRLWSETKPVLHLAVALNGQRPEPNYKGNLPLVEMIWSPEWIIPALESAEALRQIIARSAVLRISAENQIRLLPE